MVSHKDNFEELLGVLIEEGNPLITKEKWERIVNFLKGIELKVSKSFELWVKSRKFRIMNYPTIGLKDVLFVPFMKNDKPLSDQFRHVPHTDEFWDILYNCHYTQLAHADEEKTHLMVSASYDFLPVNVVSAFIKTCPVCKTTNKKRKEASVCSKVNRKTKQSAICHPLIQPSFQTDFMNKGQIEFIDMQHRPDGVYNYIGHYMDLWSRLHVVFPLATKCAEEVTENLEKKVFAHFGFPRILLSTRGQGFVQQVINKVREDWGDNIKINNGKLMHHLGMVERCNTLIKNKLACRFREEREENWSDWLVKMQFQLNTLVNSTTRHTSNQLIFARKRGSTFDIGNNKLITMEEDVKDSIEYKSHNVHRGKARMKGKRKAIKVEQDHLYCKQVDINSPRKRMRKDNENHPGYVLQEESSDFIEETVSLLLNDQLSAV